MKIRKIAEKVKTILETNMEARDSNESLYLSYIGELGYGADNTYGEIINAVKTQIIPPISSVARASRKCQQLYPELRGKNYIKRYNKQMEFIEFALDERV